MTVKNFKILYKTKAFKQAYVGDPLRRDKRAVYKELVKAMKGSNSIVKPEHIRSFGASDVVLSGLFNWSSTKQGHSYWLAILNHSNCMDHLCDENKKRHLVIN